MSRFRGLRCSGPNFLLRGLARELLVLAAVLIICIVFLFIASIIELYFCDILIFSPCVVAGESVAEY